MRVRIWERSLAFVSLSFHFDTLSMQNQLDRRKKDGLAESHKIILNLDIKYGDLDSFIYVRNTLEHLLLARYFIPKCGKYNGLPDRKYSCSQRV